MRTFKVLIEIGKDGTYGAYLKDADKAPYGIVGDGKSVKEAIDDFMAGYAEMREYYMSEGKAFEEVSFSFEYDTASFLEYYAGRLTLAGLSRITGINQGQLSHYVTGHRRPSPSTVKRIEEGIHSFGKELSNVQLT